MFSSRNITKKVFLEIEEYPEVLNGLTTDIRFLKTASGMRTSLSPGRLSMDALMISLRNGKERHE